MTKVKTISISCRKGRHGQSIPFKDGTSKCLTCGHVYLIYAVPLERDQSGLLNSMTKKRFEFDDDISNL